MTNEEHLALLRQGINVWNNWRESNPEIRPNLLAADLRGADLREADLSGANLRGADLSTANLSAAIFYRADLRGADFRGSNFTKAYLPIANLIEANLSGTNLTKTNLREANLREADLREADLSGADLSEANLSEANLERTKVWDVNFNKAIFTGACLSGWQTNIATNFNDVICDYVYLRSGNQERRPSSGNFAPREFTKLFQKALKTVELIFDNGIDWRAFLISLQKLKIENSGNELSIQAIENKNDGLFVIRANVSPDANKAEIEKYLKREYELTVKVIDEQYRSQFKAEDEQLIVYRQQSTDLTEIVKLMASRTINEIADSRGA